MTKNTQQQPAPVANLYQVAIPSPLRKQFDYLAPADYHDTLLPGCRVRAPFGVGNRSLVGIIVGCTSSSSVPRSRLKAISEVIDAEPLIPETLFNLFLWAAAYYQHPIGEALAAVFPSLLRQGEAAPGPGEPGWVLTTHGKGLPETALKNAPRQQQLLNLLQNQGEATTAHLKSLGITSAITRQLEQKGLIAPTTVIQASTAAKPLEAPLQLTPEQQQAIDKVTTEGFQCSLLHGETGSGKTEVYLQIIQRIIEQGRQALVLVPEISLTPQTLKRFSNRFGCTIAALHSGLTNRERALAWEQARTGTAPIVIGTRSAIFTPLAQPGIIIADEEHDNSFKQRDGFRYNARDLAVLRGQRENIPVVLGSATPSLESLHNSRQNRYQYLRLSQRAGNARQPDWSVIDIRRQTLQQGMSEQLLSAIGKTLKAGNQAMVFLNRRGFAPALRCRDCGWIANCHRCDAHLTFHRNPDRTICHHCEHNPPLPATCPACRSNRLTLLGQGTARAEETLQQCFPNFPVLRIDRDSTRKKQAMANMLDQVSTGQPCVLVGTQMLAKGHHFPDVTLVAIVDADAGLFSPDFRAPEKMAQLILQVAGRAGRGSKPGQVLLQSHHADHPFLELLSTRGYSAFSEQLLTERSLTGLPPFGYMALLKAEARSPATSEAFLNFARQTAESFQPDDAQATCLGPLPAPMEKRRGRFRYQLTLAAVERKTLQPLLSRLCLYLEQAPISRTVRWAIDVDPQDMS